MGREGTHWDWDQYLWLTFQHLCLLSETSAQICKYWLREIRKGEQMVLRWGCSAQEGVELRLTPLLPCPKDLVHFTLSEFSPRHYFENSDLVFSWVWSLVPLSVWAWRWSQGNFEFQSLGQKHYNSRTHDWPLKSWHFWCLNLWHWPWLHRYSIRSQWRVGGPLDVGKWVVGVKTMYLVPGKYPDSPSPVIWGLRWGLERGE